MREFALITVSSPPTLLLICSDVNCVEPQRSSAIDRPHLSKKLYKEVGMCVKFVVWMI